MGMKVLSVASEAAGLVKTGGLADVAGALPAALAARVVVADVARALVGSGRWPGATVSRR